MQQLEFKPIQKLDSWQSLIKHAESLRFTKIKSLRQSSARNYALQVATENISIDFSRQSINEHTLQLLVALANERHLVEKISSLINGKVVNLSECIPALHTALRSDGVTPIMVDSRNIMDDILSVRAQMREVSRQIRSGEWLGYSGKPIIDIVNIGIGGSDLGPRFCIKALSSFCASHLRYHFISDADPDALKEVIGSLNPETTLFIVSSKSFATPETLFNAKAAMAWLDRPFDIDKHFIAVSANEARAKAFGFNRVLPIWSWVGGRYSLCSAINLITAIAIGHEQFLQLLAGANRMDRHFQSTPFESNLPVLLALIGIWNNNFLNIPHVLIWTYSQRLEYFVAYIQQLEMESNGKSIDNHGNAVNYATGPIIWGGLGNQAQHSYYQLLCQGTHRVTADFISLMPYHKGLINESCETKQRILAEGTDNASAAINYIEGNHPVNHIRLDACTPSVIGELIALYEHKVYTQSVIWDINPFDQPAVDSAKKTEYHPSSKLKQ